MTGFFVMVVIRLVGLYQWINVRTLECHCLIFMIFND